MGMVGGLFAASAAANAMGSLSSAYSESQAIKMQGNYNKNQLQFNAQVAALQAKDAKARGARSADSKRIETRQAIASQRVALAAQGVDVNKDTSSQIQQDTADLGAQDVATIKNNAWREAWGYEVQNLDYSTQAKFEDLSSKLNSRQTLLTGGLNAARDISSGATTWEIHGESLKKAYNKK